MSELARVLPWGRDESELVAGLQSGSDAAFDWLVTHYHGQVFSLLYGMLGDSADAADCTQEVFLKSFRGIRGFRRGSSLKTWLYRIAVREALNHKRWHWRHSRQQVSLEGEREADMGFVEPESHTESPFEWMAAQEVREVVQGALQKVPEVYRTAVILRDLEGFSYEEISEVLDVSIGTVKSRMLRGRRCLREILKPLLENRGAEAETPRPPANRADAERRFERGNAVMNTDHASWAPESRRAAGLSAGGVK